MGLFGSDDDEDSDQSFRERVEEIRQERSNSDDQERSDADNTGDEDDSPKSFRERVEEIRQERKQNREKNGGTSGLREEFREEKQEAYEKKKENNEISEETKNQYPALNCEPQGAHVTLKRFKKITGLLDESESVHFILTGQTIDVEGAGAGGSLFGNDRSRKMGTTGFVRTVVTDQRIAVKIPQLLGTDERSIPYDSITSVDLDTGLAHNRLTLQTPGQTYHIEVNLPGKMELRKVTKFIRQQIMDDAGPSSSNRSQENDVNPLEQIEKLKDLYDKGAISEKEFEEKKRELLDQV